jgi:hypothetical protein
MMVIMCFFYWLHYMSCQIITFVEQSINYTTDGELKDVEINRERFLTVLKVNPSYFVDVTHTSHAFVFVYVH